ncbi:MAG TPA: hypothetical protein VJL54_05350 [Nitrososphaera sp.]|jgi:hypothetical protein|nr:hypothetical protein [Nitrososphaera sp.]HKX81664.1 hypothetical protein [Nitrososphaera sp.]
MKFEYEEFATVEDVFLYLVSVAPYMKQVLPISSYKGYIFSIVPLTPLTGETLMMIYTKGSLDPGLVEFDVSTKKFRQVSAVERADKNYFIVLSPKVATLADVAIENLR